MRIGYIDFEVRTVTGMLLLLTSLSMAVESRHDTAALSSAESTPQLARCLWFSRPMGASRSGDAEQRDSAMYTAELVSGGGVTRRHVKSGPQRAMWERRSSWSMKGDTLAVRIFTGLVGWELSLRAAPPPVGQGFAGTARYLTDAVTAEAQPLVVPVSAKLIDCPR